MSENCLIQVAKTSSKIFIPVFHVYILKIIFCLMLSVFFLHLLYFLYPIFLFHKFNDVFAIDTF